MSYFLKDVDTAEALVRKTRPETLIERGDYGWSLSIRDKDSSVAVILFQPRRDDMEQPEIESSQETILDICFWLGSQWTVEEAEKLARRFPGGHDINRIQ